MTRRRCSKLHQTHYAPYSIITQPEDGVKEGETFMTPMSDPGPSLNIPTGFWKDGLFDFCKYGVCSPHAWCACLCTQIAMGQIMHRLKLTWLGESGSYAQTKNTFKVVVTIVLAYLVFSMAMDYMSPEYVYGYYAQPPAWISTLKNIGALLMSVWSIYALMKTREHVRGRYQIPEERCHGCEDLCCSIWCSPCTVAQISRHTGEYEAHPSMCCTETGLPRSAPQIV
jgi:Cys-rich protein (TIGR01571 family)